MEDVIELSSASDGEESLPVKYERNKRFRIIWRMATRMISPKIASDSGIFPYNGLRHLLIIIKDKTHDIKNVQLKEFIFRKLLHFFEAVKFAYRGIGEDEKFNFLLVEFMALYTNLICEQFKQLSEDSTVVSNLVTALHIIFSGKSHFTILTLLRAAPNVVLYPIYKKYLLNRKLHDGYNMVRYIPLVLCYRKWKKIESDVNMESEIDTNCMLRGLLPRRVPPVDDMNRCFTWISDLVGFAIQNGDKGTSILLEKESMDLDESIDKYFKQYGQYIARHCSYKLLESTQNITLAEKLDISNTAYPPSNTTNDVLHESSAKESDRVATVRDDNNLTASARGNMEPFGTTSNIQNKSTMDSKCDTKLSNQSQSTFSSKQSLPRNRDNNLRVTSRGTSRTSTSLFANSATNRNIRMNSRGNRSKQANSVEVIVIDSSSSSDEETTESPEGEVSSTTNWDDDRQCVNHAKELSAISQTLSTNSTTTTASALPRFNIENSRLKERRDAYFSAEVSSSAIDCTNFELSKTYESVNSPKVMSSDTPQECLGNNESSIAGDSNPIATSISPESHSRSQESDELSPATTANDTIDVSVSNENRKPDSADELSESSSEPVNVDMCSIEQTEEESQAAATLNVMCEDVEDISDVPSVEDVSSLVEDEVHQNSNESCQSPDFSCDVNLKIIKIDTLVRRHSDVNLIYDLSEVGKECLHRFKMHSYLSGLLSAFNRLGSFSVNFPDSQISPSNGYHFPFAKINNDFYNSRLFYGETTVARYGCRQLVESGYFKNNFSSIASCSNDAYPNMTNITNGASKLIINWDQIPDKSIHLSLLLEGDNGFSTTVGLTLKLAQENVNFDSSIYPPTQDPTTRMSSLYAFNSPKSRFGEMPLCLPNKRAETTNRAFISTPVNYRMLTSFILPNALTTVQRMNLICGPAIVHDNSMRTIINLPKLQMLPQNQIRPHALRKWPPIMPRISSNGFSKLPDSFRTARNTLAEFRVPRNYFKTPLVTQHATVTFPFSTQVYQENSKPLKPLIIANSNSAKDKKMRKRKHHPVDDTQRIPFSKPIAIIAPTFVEDILQEKFRDDRPKEIDPTGGAAALKRRKILKENEIDTAPPRQIIHNDFEPILNDKKKTSPSTTPCYVMINSSILHRSLLYEKRKSAAAGADTSRSEVKKKKSSGSAMVINGKRKSDIAEVGKELEGGKKKKNDRVPLQNASHKYTSYTVDAWTEEHKKSSLSAGGLLNGKRKFETVDSAREPEGRKKKNQIVAKSMQNAKNKNDSWRDENRMLRDDLREMNLEKLESEIDILLKALSSLAKKPSVEAYFLLNKMVVTFLYECLSSRDCSQATFGRKYTSFCTATKQLQATNVDNVDLSKIKEKYVELKRNTKSLELLNIIRLLDETLGRLEAIKANLFKDDWLQSHTSQIQQHKRTVPIERAFDIKDKNMPVLEEECESDYDIPETKSQSSKVEDPIYEDLTEDEESKSPIQFDQVPSPSDNFFSEQFLHIDRPLLQLGKSNLDVMPYVPSADPIDILPQNNYTNGSDINLYNEIEVESHVSDDVNNFFAQHGQSSWQMYSEKRSDHESDGLIGTGAESCDDDEDFREFKEYAAKTIRSRLMNSSRDDNATFDDLLGNRKDNNDVPRNQSLTSREHAYMRPRPTTDPPLFPYESERFESRFHISPQSDDFLMHSSSQLHSSERSSRKNSSPIESSEDSSREDTELDGASYDLVS